MSKIEWTGKTWNPVTGCSKTSEGCRNCYAEKMAIRLKAMGQPKYQNGFEITWHESELAFTPKSNLVFVCSMGDLFHNKVPYEFIDGVMGVIRSYPNSIFQILTKRPKNMKQYFSINTVPSNAWLGVSVENRLALSRIDRLREIDTALRFISFEPLLSDVETLDLRNIHWVIVGGESGSKARPMQKEWVENIHKQCQQANIPFFFKQWGMYGEDGIKRTKRKNGSLLNGKIWQEMPNT